MELILANKRVQKMDIEDRAAAPRKLRSAIS